jgi:hypothetical protein
MPWTFLSINHLGQAELGSDQGWWGSEWPSLSQLLLWSNILQVTQCKTPAILHWGFYTALQLLCCILISSWYLFIWLTSISFLQWKVWIALHRSLGKDGCFWENTWRSDWKNQTTLSQNKAEAQLVDHGRCWGHAFSQQPENVRWFPWRWQWPP